MKIRYQQGRKVGYITIAVNSILALFKTFVALTTNSTAMAADAIHSVSDILSTIAVVISFKIAEKPEDLKHPYGHEKAESIGAKIVAILLLFAGLRMGWKSILSFNMEESSTPKGLALYAAIASIIIKETMFWYTIKIGERINSPALIADAWHHRSDAFSSIATFLGIAAARMGFSLGDPIAALIVSIMIIKAAYDILKQSIEELMDSSAAPDTVNLIYKTIESVPGVNGIDNLRTRMHGNLIYADVEILVDKSITVSEGHKIADKVENTVISKIDSIKAIMVHVHPW